MVGPNISSDDLEKTIETVNDSYQKLKLNHFYDATAPDATHDNLGPQPNGQRIFYRSDHYNFAKMGIPIAFFTTGLHVDYHRPTDTPEKIDFKEIQVVSKTVAAVGWVLANRAGPSAVEGESARSVGEGHEDRARTKAGARSRRCCRRCPASLTSFLFGIVPVGEPLKTRGSPTIELRAAVRRFCVAQVLGPAAFLLCI